MRRPPWATVPVVVLVAVVALVAVVLAVALTSGGGGSTPPKPAGVASDVMAKIPASGGITLSAEVITPSGRGPFPLLVMPGGWGSGATEYRLPGRNFAAQGYQVVGYAQRGFEGSGGAIDFAAPTTRRDVTTVIDWALAHTRANSSHIGMLGISYGAGISLLAAAADPRIKAIVAMSGWSDLAAALAPDGTANAAALHLLLDGYRTKPGALSPELQALGDSLSGGDASRPAAVLTALSPIRSADRDVAALNRNRPAIMLANAYQDSIVDPAQIVPFFDRLTTPKRLQMAPGEHGGPEAAGLAGKPDRTFADAHKWLDHYLLDRSNGIDHDRPIQLMDGRSGAVHAYRTWPTARANSTVTMPVQSRTLVANTDSGAQSGPIFTMQPNPFHPPTMSVSAVKPEAAYVWSDAAQRRSTLISGSPSVHLDVAASTSPATFFFYLYDVDASSSATLITFAAVTAAGGNTTIALRPASWTIDRGHHLVLVADTADDRYQSQSPAGSTVTLFSTEATPASVTLPTG